MDNKSSDDKYKQENWQHQHGKESDINKTKEEDSLIKRLMSIKFEMFLIQYVIGTVTS